MRGGQEERRTHAPRSYFQTLRSPKRSYHASLPAMGRRRAVYRGNRLPLSSDATNVTHKGPANLCTRNTMKSAIKVVTLLLIAASSPIEAQIHQNLVGEYQGHVKQSDGYDIHAGDPCVAKITKSDLYGGSLSFSLDSADTIVIEIPKISAAMWVGGRKVQLLPKPERPDQDVKMVFMILRKNDCLLILRLSRANPQSGSKRLIACGELLRK